MPSLGPLEILVIFIVALLVFGPNKLPELARQVGKGLAEFRKVQHHLKGELDDAIHSVMDDDKPKVAPQAAPTTVTPTPVESAAVDSTAVESAAVESGSGVPTPAIEPAAPTGEARPNGGSLDPGPTPPPLADDA